MNFEFILFLGETSGEIVNLGVIIFLLYKI